MRHLPIRNTEMHVMSLDWKPYSTLSVWWKMLLTPVEVGSSKLGRNAHPSNIVLNGMRGEPPSTSRLHWIVPLIFRPHACDLPTSFDYASTAMSRVCTILA